jgi:hypothetical protein
VRDGGPLDKFMHIKRASEQKNEQSSLSNFVLLAFTASQHFYQIHFHFNDIKTPFAFLLST